MDFGDQIEIGVATAVIGGLILMLVAWSFKQNATKQDIKDIADALHNRLESHIKEDEAVNRSVHDRLEAGDKKFDRLEEKVDANTDATIRIEERVNHLHESMKEILRMLRRKQ